MLSQPDMLEGWEGKGVKEEMTQARAQRIDGKGGMVNHL